MGQVIEYLVIVIIGLGVLGGLMQGFVRIFFSWFSVLVGFIVALNFSYGITQSFFPTYSNNIIITFLIGVVLFSLVYLLMSNLSYLCTSFFEKARITGLNHLLGGIFGGAQMMILVGLAVYWVVRLDWAPMETHPVSMFSAYWAEKIILLVGDHMSLINKLVK